MSWLPLATRVVEVIADQGETQWPRYRYGSGCIVAGRTVLTAAHVVVGAVRVLVRGPDKVLHEATVDEGFVGDPNGPQPDLALVEVDGSAIELPAIDLAAVDRASASADPVERCHVIGYPMFMEQVSPGIGRFRDTVDALGHVPVLSRLAGGLISVQVSSSPRELPPGRIALQDSEWSGMSGGPVIADGYLLGVVTEHAQREGNSSITATPLTALQSDPAHPAWGSGVTNPEAWWARLRVKGPEALRLLPATGRKVEPSYRATVREIHQRTRMLIGRQEEFAAIASFANGSGGYRWLVAGPWAGKTSLLAEVTVMIQGQVDVVCYFLSRREADADSSHFLLAVVPQLAYLLGEDSPTADLHQFRALWQRSVERTTTDDRHLLLVVDGLDEDLRPPGLPSVAALLPPSAGGRVHVLVSSRPHPELPLDMPLGHALTSVQPVTMEPFAGAQALATLAQQEIDGLIHRDDDGLASDVLGLLTAASGPLAVEDLAALTAVAPASAALTRRIRRLLTLGAGRSLQVTSQTGINRYQFAHESLLKYAQVDENLKDSEFRLRIHRWAQYWHDAGWPPAASDEKGTPLYLLDTYPSTLSQDPPRLAALVSDAGWINTAIRSVGVAHVIADLRRAAAAEPTSEEVAAMLAAVTGQAHHLQPFYPLTQPGYILRQLCMEATEFSSNSLASDLRIRLQSMADPALVPLWTTRQANPVISSELGHQLIAVRSVSVTAGGQLVTVGDNGSVLTWDLDTPGSTAIDVDWVHETGFRAVLEDGRVVTDWGHWVRASAVLADGRLVTGQDDGRVLVWDPAVPASKPIQLGHHDRGVLAMALLADGQVVTGGRDGRVLVWNPTMPGGKPVNLGKGKSGVRVMTVLPDGRVVTGGRDGRILIWDPTAPGRADRLGDHPGGVPALAVLPDGRVVTGGRDGRILIWDPTAPGRADRLGDHPGGVPALAVLPDGRVVTGGRDGRILIWDWAISGGRQAGLDHRARGVLAITMLNDGRVVTGAEDGWVQVWDPAARDVGPVKLGRHSRRAYEANRGVVAMARMGDQRVVTGGKDGRVLIWNPAIADGGSVKLGRHDQLQAIAVSTNGRVVTGGGDGRILIWNPASLDNGPTKLGDQHPVRAIAALPDGQVVTGGENGRILIWNLTTQGQGPLKLGDHQGLGAIAILPDGRVVTGGEDGRILIWNPVTPGIGSTKLGDHRGVRAIAVLADGRVVTGANERVIVWHPAHAGTELAELACSVTALAADPQRPGGLLAVAHRTGGFSLLS